jgi:molecular chaperone DnaJ
LQAILGAEIEVETFDGKKRLKIPNGTQPGQSLRLGGYGIPSLKGHGRGDLLYSVEVEIPRKLKKQEEEKLREIAEANGESIDEPVGLFGKKKK